MILRVVGMLFANRRTVLSITCDHLNAAAAYYFYTILKREIFLSAES